MSKTGKKLIRGSILQGAAFGCSAIANLIIMPIVIGSMGDHQYGVWVLIGTFMGYYGILDLGLTTAATKYISEAIGNQDVEEANRIIAVSSMLFAISGLIVFCVSMIVAFNCDLFFQSVTESRIFSTVILVMGGSMFFAFCAKSFMGILCSYLRYDILSVIEIVLISLRTICIVLYFERAAGILELAFITAVFGVCRSLLIICMGIKVHGSGVPLKMDFTRGHVKKMFKYSSMTFLSQIADLFRFRMTPFIVTILVGLPSLAGYQIANRLLELSSKLCDQMAALLMPVFSKMQNVEMKVELRWKFLFNYKIACYLSGFLLGILIVTGKPFIERWMGRDYLYIMPLFYILIVGWNVSVIQTPSINVLQGISKHGIYTITNWVHGILLLALCIIFTQLYGLVGVGVGITSSAFIARYLLLSALFVKKTRIVGLLEYYLKTLIYLAIPYFFILIVYVISKSYIRPIYENLMITVFLAFIAYCPYIFFFGFSSEEKSLLLRSILPQKIYSRIYT